VLENFTQVGNLTFPFIAQGKDLGYTREIERGRGKEEREKQGRRRSRSYVVLLL
jgi:hypothetical protein